MNQEIEIKRLEVSAGSRVYSAFNRNEYQKQETNVSGE
jgi:hypothetical protein